MKLVYKNSNRKILAPRPLIEICTVQQTAAYHRITRLQIMTPKQFPPYSNDYCWLLSQHFFLSCSGDVRHCPVQFPSLAAFPRLPAAGSPPGQTEDGQTQTGDFWVDTYTRLLPGQRSKVKGYNVNPCQHNNCYDHKGETLVSFEQLIAVCVTFL